MNLLNIISDENCVIPNIGYSRYIFQEQSARISWTYSTIRATCRCSRIVENPAQITRTVCVCVCMFASFMVGELCQVVCEFQRLTDRSTNVIT